MACVGKGSQGRLRASKVTTLRPQTPCQPPEATRQPGSVCEGVNASGNGRGLRGTDLCGRVHVPVILRSPSRLSAVEVPRRGCLPGTLLFLPFP